MTVFEDALCYDESELPLYHCTLRDLNSDEEECYLPATAPEPSEGNRYLQVQCEKYNSIYRLTVTLGAAYGGQWVKQKNHLGGKKRRQLCFRKGSHLAGTVIPMF